MGYVEIVLAAATPAEVVKFVRQRVEPVLRDVRHALEYPKVNGQPGFNMTAAGALCGVVGGLSRVFFSGTKGDGASFRQVANRYAAIDSASAIDPTTGQPDAAKFADKLYGVYRCNLAHALGLSTKWDDKLSRWAIKPLQVQTKVTRWEPLPVTEARLQELDKIGPWPANLPPTLSQDGGVERLNVDAFYCGIRRLTQELAEDSTLAHGAVAILSDWLSPPSTVQASQLNTMSSTNTIVSTNTFGSADSTLGPVASVGSGAWSETGDGDAPT
jgi:hypothetical protein